jgi:hypothetical protein
MDRLDALLDRKLAAHEVEQAALTPRLKTPAAPKCVTTPKPAA